MEQQIIEYMISNPSNMQIDSLKNLYSSILKQLTAINQFKNQEADKLRDAYNNGDDKDIEVITKNRILIKNKINEINNILYILENYLYKGYTIYADVSESNTCPVCNKMMATHTLHYLIYDSKDKEYITGRDYTKSCYCDNCKRRYILNEYYEMLKRSQDINNTNILINKNYCLPSVNIYSIIVLSNTLKCSVNNHKTMDIAANIPALSEDGELSFTSVAASYCSTCNRFTILKEDFNKIKDRVLCKIIDESSENKSPKKDEIEIEQRKSLLFYYGYNVQSKTNLSDKQRQIILSSVIEAHIMDRRDIINHITTLIERGSKIALWNTATQKWKRDRDFVSNYKLGELPQVIFEKVIERYTYTK